MMDDLLQLRFDIERLQKIMEGLIAPQDPREFALVKTKIDEAALWLSQVKDLVERQC